MYQYSYHLEWQRLSQHLLVSEPVAHCSSECPLKPCRSWNVISLPDPATTMLILFTIALGLYPLPRPAEPSWDSWLYPRLFVLFLNLSPHHSGNPMTLKHKEASCPVFLHIVHCREISLLPWPLLMFTESYPLRLGKSHVQTVAGHLFVGTWEEKLMTATSGVAFNRSVSFCLIIWYSLSKSGRGVIAQSCDLITPRVESSSPSRNHELTESPSRVRAVKITFTFVSGAHFDFIHSAIPSHNFVNLPK